MDEPFAALDAQTREILQEELLALMQRPDERKTMVFITHSIDEAILLGDRIAVMSARPGRIKEMLDDSVRPAARRRMRCAPIRASPSCAPISGTSCSTRRARGRMTVQVHDRAPTGDRGAGRPRRAPQAIAAPAPTAARSCVILIRVVSLAVVLGALAIVGAEIDPVLFTTPSAVASAAVR